eukprot:c25927_g1_i1 orf=275-1267(-)
MAEEKMQAVQYTRYGGGVEDLQYVEVRIPTPKKGELLLKIEAASVNPVDWKIQKGQMRPLIPSKFPYTPGCDVSGEVISMGPDVKTFNPGDKVVSWLYIWRGGAFAEYAVAPVKYTVKRPLDVSAIDGACLPIAGMTALQAVRDYAGVKLDGSSNANLLITAASGGVGHFAVQLAKLGGAHVTATCGARNIDLVKSLGADEVLDYKTSEGAELKSPSGRKYDCVIHCVAGFSWPVFQSNLTPHGKVIDVSPNFKSIANSVVKKLTCSKQSLAALFMIPRSTDLQLLVDLVKEGKLKCVLDSKHTLPNFRDAWSKIFEGHATGKVVVINEK